jgi:hypothetical protein
MHGYENFYFVEETEYFFNNHVNCSSCSIFSCSSVIEMSLRFVFIGNHVLAITYPTHVQT